nr:integrase, catalytic region, zinc finger, CCHC-type, peptidase aspartic, catalytic [Tanacetum cinerariifolium]
MDNSVSNQSALCFDQYIELNELKAQSQEKDTVISKLKGRIKSLYGNAYPLTRITTTIEVPSRKPISLETDTPKPIVTLVYSRKLRKSKTTDPVCKSKDVQIVLWYLDSSCSKHMTEDRSQLTNFNKFLGTVKFKNDHVAKIMGYGDYQIRNVTISRVYYVEGLGHNLFSQNGVAERRNCMLIEAARTILIYAKALLLWEEAVATSCYTQNCSIIRLRHEKTPYELLHKKPPDLSFLHVFGALCYPTNDSQNLDKCTRRIIKTIHVDLDELTTMASEHSSLEPAFYEMTPAIISSGLMRNPPSSKLFVPPSKTDWDLLFQPLFDELLTPLCSVDFPAPKVIAPNAEVVAPEPVASTGSPSSAIVDQDTPSPSNSQTTPETQTSIISNDDKEDNHDLDVARMNNDTFFGDEESPKTLTFHDDPLHESLQEDSTSQGSSLNIRQTVGLNLLLILVIFLLLAFGVDAVKEIKEKH